MNEYETDLEKMMKRIASIVVIRIRENDMRDAFTDTMSDLRKLIDFVRVVDSSKK